MITKCLSITISNVTKLKQRWTDEIVVGAVRWQFKICREYHENEDSLCVFMFCCVRNNKSYVASTKMTLHGRKTKEEYIEANVFEGTGLGSGECLCKWNELINEANGYIENGEIKITLVLQMSRGPQAELITIESTENIFLFHLKKASQLVAVRSEEFQKMDQKWLFLIHTASNGDLLVTLERLDGRKKYASNITMLVTINSRHGNKKWNVQKTDSKRVKRYETHDIKFAAPWKQYFLNDEALIKIQLIFN